ncbi:MAG: YeeE/YedE family protein [Gammaproteobacteria bacterium]|nr:YeeE/YedE family protein [Gammaproteobacteria bacterium]
MTHGLHLRAAYLLSALASGILFGLGLVISQMVDPAKIIGFLDITGEWDPTLAVVFAGALMVSIPAFHWILKRPHPLLATSFVLPTKTELDLRLIGGAALFGIGWGLAGFCPGPAVTALVTFAPPVIIFVAAMLAGTWLYGRLVGP